MEHFFLIRLLEFFGTPFDGKRISENLERIGFVNRAGEPPVLIEKHRDKKNKRIIVMNFDSVGFPLYIWVERRLEIESALNYNIADIKAGKNKRRILLCVTSAKTVVPENLYWSDKYLEKESFVLRLGESLMGSVTVNLAKIPHILLGGSTGSGKSILLKIILIQCIQKGAEAYIADFKGGVDFPAVWHQKCHFIMDERALLKVLSDIVEELEQRKKQFALTESANIDDYNKVSDDALNRIVFAIDEVAEVLDKTGLSKDEKEIISIVESRLSTIARQGRAFGIHLILATQRPDATILSGQIKNNIDCRICGRADNVLSQIILDNTSAADQIPKDAQGRFIMQDGTVFQGYLIDDGSVFGK